MGLKIVLVGDSDIARWPEHLLPFSDTSGGDAGGIGAPASNHSQNVTHSVSGHSGATLTDIIEPFQAELERIYQSETILRKHNSEENPSRSISSIILIVCAGENDIGRGIPLSDSVGSFEALLQTTFQNNYQATSDGVRVHLIFLGPKLEPWLAEDRDSRKAYIRMSRCLERICQSSNKPITYVDCLTMFCGESANLPGALYGERAVPMAHYFDADQLHLSNDGYELWKNTVENVIRSI